MLFVNVYEDKRFVISTLCARILTGFYFTRQLDSGVVINVRYRTVPKDCRREMGTSHAH